MRPAAVALVVAALGTAAGGQTRPLTVEGITWDRCVRLMEAYGRAFAERGWGRGQVIDAADHRATALITGREIIIMRCERGDAPTTFTRRAVAM